MLLRMVAVAQTPGEPAGSFLRAVSEIGHRIRHARRVRPEIVTPNRSGGHLRNRAAAFPRRLYATATMESRSPLRGVAPVSTTLGRFRS